MRLLRQRRPTPQQIKRGHVYTWHKVRWIVMCVNVFSTCDGFAGGVVTVRSDCKSKLKTVSIEDFASVARRDYGLDEWRKERDA